MYFRRLLCARIKIDQLYYMNCWVIIHCLSRQLYNWPISTQQFTARADLFLKQYKGTEMQVI